MNPQISSVSRIIKIIISKTKVILLGLLKLQIAIIIGIEKIKINNKCELKLKYFEPPGSSNIFSKPNIIGSKFHALIIKIIGDSILFAFIINLY